MPRIDPVEMLRRAVRDGSGSIIGVKAGHVIEAARLSQMDRVKGGHQLVLSCGSLPPDTTVHVYREQIQGIIEAIPAPAPAPEEAPDDPV